MSDTAYQALGALAIYGALVIITAAGTIARRWHRSRERP
jgi:hypothetical protein